MKLIEIPGFQDFDIKTTVGQKIWKDVKDGRFRIVKFKDIGDDPWYLLKQTSWMWNWIRQWRWEPCNGYDRGANGDYNYQAIRTMNAGILLTSIADIVRHELTGTAVKDNGRDALPGFPIEKEVHMWVSLVELGQTDFSASNWLQELNERIIYKI